ncbi:unnamed protein product [Mytilus coruscus]|uniref:Ig-like domain-containing protein n=1 Tax=Mytilus coruscus TaxID=42192 RepID=A0A6J8DFI4_MYTCO|nr:unnamed protein product [Mytilus coruscus]
MNHKLDNKALVSSLALFSTSQTRTETPSCIETGQSVTLRCETTDITSIILFNFNRNNKGGCTGGTYATGIAEYGTLAQLGKYTELTIRSYDHSRDRDHWTCNYGATPSKTFTVELGIYSQTLTVTPSCIETGQPVTLRCETTDITSAILFYLNGNNKGGCTGGKCATGIAEYCTPT